MNKIPVILDGDPGHDDAIAWMLAFASPALDIKAVVSVQGNVFCDKTTYNALRVTTLLGRQDVPVARGADKPLLGEPIGAPSIHGVSGLDGPELPLPAQSLSELSGVELMAKVLAESERPVTIIATGPLTNVATLLNAYPHLKEKIERISLMGGGILSGNWTPAAEFNILVDPEAAKAVFDSGVPIIMSPLDVTEKALVMPEDFERIRRVGNPVSTIVAEWLEFFYKFHRSVGYAGAPMHDPCAVAVLIKPELFSYVDMYVDVETGGQYCRGCTVGDLYDKSGRAPNVRVLMNLDRQGFVDMLVEAAKYYTEALR